LIWLQVPVSTLQGPAAPIVADNHDAEDVAVRFSEPSPAFFASAVWLGPFDPGATGDATVIEVVLRTRRGAANNAAGHRLAANTAANRSPLVQVIFLIGIGLLHDRDQSLRDHWFLTKSSMTALRSRAGGNSPWARIKSWNFCTLNFWPRAFSAAWRISSKRVIPSK